MAGFNEFDRAGKEPSRGLRLQKLPLPVNQFRRVFVPIVRQVRECGTTTDERGINEASIQLPFHKDGNFPVIVGLDDERFVERDSERGIKADAQLLVA